MVTMIPMLHWQYEAIEWKQRATHVINHNGGGLADVIHLIITAFWSTNPLGFDLQFKYMKYVKELKTYKETNWLLA